MGLVEVGIRLYDKVDDKVNECLHIIILGICLSHRYD